LLLTVLKPKGARKRLNLFYIPLFMYRYTLGSGIRDENLWDLDPGSGMKNLGIRDKTSRIRNTGLANQKVPLRLADKKSRILKRWKNSVGQI
jgi:hypothetical protein